MARLYTVFLVASLIADCPITTAISCYNCHGTSVSAVTSSCWETVDAEHARFVASVQCDGSCSIVVLNHTSIGLRDFTRSCDVDCKESCFDTPFGTKLCKYCCSSDWCNAVIPTHQEKKYSKELSVSTENLKFWLEKHFSKPRHHASDPSHKLYTRHYMSKLLTDFGLKVERQEFSVSETHAEDRAPFNFRSFIRTTTSGYNIIAISPGLHYQTNSDRIIVILANYDTHLSGTPGVNDNGSGSAALLELGRLISNDKCSRNNTVIFVATDYKEQGIFRQEDGVQCLSHVNYVNKVGSSHFVCRWLLPHLERFGGELLLAINLESLLNVGNSRSSDPWPESHQNTLNKLAPYGTRFLMSMQERSFSRDWWMVKLSTEAFEALSRIAKEKHLVEDDFLYFQLNTSTDEKTRLLMKDFLHSDDCAPFHEVSSRVLPCLTISDTGNLRGYMKRCHHAKCDNLDNLTPKRLRSLVKVIDLLRRYIRGLSESKCEMAKNSTSETGKTVSICNSALIKKTSKRTFISATCGRSGTIFEMCPTLQGGIWGLVDSSTAWIPKKMKFGKAPLWFQVDFGKIVNVSAIAVQGVERVGYVKSYMLSSSNNERDWNWHIPLKSQWTESSNRAQIKGNSNSREIAKSSLNPVISARFIRIYPRKKRRQIALRVQMYGCNSE